MVSAMTRGPRSVFGWPPACRTAPRSPGSGIAWRAVPGAASDIWLFAADGSDATPTAGRNLSAPARPDAGRDHEQRRHGRGRHRGSCRSADGRWITFSAPIDGAYELWRIAVDDGRLERLTEGRHYVSGWDAQAGSDRLPALDADRRRRTCGCSTSHAGGSGAPDFDAPRRLTTFNAEVLAEVELREPRERESTVDGRRIQGWFIPPAGDDGRPRAALGTARGGDPRRSAHALRLVTVLGVPGPGRCRDRRLLLQPARLRGVRRGLQRRQSPRLGAGADARHPGRRRLAGRRWPGRPGPPGRDRRLVRRLPDELDRRPRPTVPGGDDLPIRQRHDHALPDRRHQRRGLGQPANSTRPRGPTRPITARSRRSATPTGSARRS